MKILASIVVMAVALSLNAQPVKPDQYKKPVQATDGKPAQTVKDTAKVAETKAEDAYAAGQFTVSGFGSYRFREFNGSVNRFGYGAELGYSFTRNFTVAAEILTENPNHSAIDQAGINGKFYVPIKDTGLAPYALIGVTRTFETDTDAFRLQSGECETSKVGTKVVEDEQWQMNAGVGIELRANKYFNAFADGRWVNDFEYVGHALFRAGLSVRF